MLRFLGAKFLFRNIIAEPLARMAGGTSHGVASRDDKEFVAALSQRRLTQLRRQLTTNLLGNPVAVGVIAVACWQYVQLESLFLWVVFSQVINLCGVALVWATRKIPPGKPCRPWLFAFTLYAAADGWTWGLASWLFLMPNDPILALFFAGVMFGVVSAGQMAFLSYLPAALCFATMILMPLGVRLATIALPMNMALAALDIVYLFIVFSIAYRASRNLDENWLLSSRLERSERDLRQSHVLLEQRVNERTEQLRNSEAQYRAVVDVQSELICRFAPNGLLTFCNEAFCRFFKAQRENLIGKVWIDAQAGLLPVSECELMRRTLAEMSVDFPTTTDEIQVSIAGAEPRWLRWSHRALFDDNQQIIEFQSSAIDMTDRRLAEERIRFLAHHDPLTELPNREMFRDHVTRAISAARGARGARRRVALMTIDLDDFKQVNDALGHDAGDSLLQEVANRFRNSIRTMDVVAHFGGERRDGVLARLGGDEFAIAFSELPSSDQAGALAERLMEAVAASFEVQGHEVQVSLSIGIAVYPDDTQDPNELRKFSDLALYRAKEDGRNRYAYYSEELGQRARRRMEIASALRNAINHNEFSLAFQPKVHATSRRLIGCEALLRWSHPQEGMIPPGDFIPIAETTGLIVSIGYWVLREACRQINEWSRVGLEPPPFSINLSPAQFSDPNLGRTIQNTMRSFDIGPGRLEVEITETTLMQNHAIAAHTLSELRDLGVIVSIDDFGSGYSSLNYLRTLPVDRLKIDRSFVVSIADNPKDQEIVRAIAQLGDSLNLATLAEGVETEGQLSTIAEIGIQEVQGYVTGRPVSAHEFHKEYLQMDKTVNSELVDAE